MAYVPGHFDGEEWIKGHEAGPISKIVDKILASGKLPAPPESKPEKKNGKRNFQTGLPEPVSLESDTGNVAVTEKPKLPEPAKPKGYKVWCKTYGSEDFGTNALVFATEEQARAWGEDLFSRWTALEEWEVRPEYTEAVWPLEEQPQEQEEPVPTEKELAILVAELSKEVARLSAIVEGLTA